MLVSDFDFPLPPELIAQQPLADRAASRLLHFERTSGKFTDRVFHDFPALLRNDDLLVFNDSRVIPARLFAQRSGVHAQELSENNPASKEFLKGRIECLLTRRTGENDWQALVRPGRKIGVGEQLTFEGDELKAEVIARGDYGERTLRFAPVMDFYASLERSGHIPLPPYIDRPDTPSDRERYQTVFSDRKNRGSIAAPTAGLHFTQGILQAIRARGIDSAKITLHVGLGTFRPLHEKIVEDNKLHCEDYSISDEAAAKISRAQNEQRRVVAIGTTTARTLEFAAAQSESGKVIASNGSADIFIYPGYKFRVVNALLTNFHLPKSSLLMLVCAFAGKENVMRAYTHAVEERYRFFSYGDCMFVE
jgi:S-adenosylmethionine:tRNA ribosyltransferase-isomerase